MSDTVFCPNCGTRNSARARFCPACGARQDEFRVEAADEAAGGAPEPEPPPVPAGVARPPAAAAPKHTQPEPTARVPGATMQERIGRVDPQAAELSVLLREHLALPGIVAAAVAASLAAGIVLAAGLLLAVITPDVSIVGLVGADANIITEGFRQAVGTVLTPMLVPTPDLIISSARRIHPLILLAIPLAALAFGTRRQLRRTEGAAPLQRLGWALLVALPFGLWMLVFAIIGGNSEASNIDVSAGNAFALGFLWGLVGGGIGALTVIPLASAVPTRPPVTTTLAAVQATLRPLAALLITCTAIALVGWLVQVGADVDDVRSDRAAATALVEEAAFAAEHGVHLTALAGGARFRADADGALGLPFPVERANDVPGGDGTFRIFAYDDVLPAYVLLPALVVLLGLVVLSALYAGFTGARAAHAGSLRAAAGWGALTGPAWAIVMAILAILAGGLYHGDADDASVFGVFLLGGAIFGAAGGALAAGGQSSAPTASSS